MNPALALLFSILLIPLVLVSSASPPSPSPPVSCTNDLVSFSPCLKFVATGVTNATDSPSARCCNKVSAAFLRNSAICLCYFIRQPDVLGFPVNATRVMSLDDFCSIDKVSGYPFSLQTLCPGSTALPPLSSITGFRPDSFRLPAWNPFQVPNVSSNEPKPVEPVPTQPNQPIVGSSATQINMKTGCSLMIALVVSILVLV